MFYLFEKGANKRIGRLSNDVHQLKQKPQQPVGEEFGHRSKLDAEQLLKVDSNHINNTENPVRKKASAFSFFNVSTEEDNSSQSSVEENNHNLPSIVPGKSLYSSVAQKEKSEMSGKQYPPLSQTIENTPRKNYQYKGRVNSAANVQTSYQAQLNKDLLLLIDSNGRYIDANNLSDESNLSRSKQSCPTVESAINTNLNFRTEPETVICHTGTNDLALLT